MSNESTLDDEDTRPEVQQLLGNLRQAMPALQALLAHCQNPAVSEGGFYRFYHQSFKVFALQEEIRQITDTLASLLPDRPLNHWYRQIVADATARPFNPETNEHWLAETRPILEGYSHARFFLEMAVKYGETLDYPPRCLPSGWAALLYLYDLR
jgi:hypothetical protein